MDKNGYATVNASIYCCTINDTSLLYVFVDGHVKITDERNFQTKSHTTKVSRGKTKIKIAKIAEVPKDTKAIKLNDREFSITDFSHQGIGGTGKK